jgi:hypothetical protein
MTSSVLSNFCDHRLQTKPSQFYWATQRGFIWNYSWKYFQSSLCYVTFPDTNDSSQKLLLLLMNPWAKCCATYWPLFSISVYLTRCMVLSLWITCFTKRNLLSSLILKVYIPSCMETCFLRHNMATCCINLLQDNYLYILELIVIRYVLCFAKTCSQHGHWSCCLGWCGLGVSLISLASEYGSRYQRHCLNGCRSLLQLRPRCSRPLIQKFLYSLATSSWVYGVSHRNKTNEICMPHSKPPEILLNLNEIWLHRNCIRKEWLCQYFDHCYKISH